MEMKEYQGTFSSGDTFTVFAENFTKALDIANEMVKEHTEQVTIIRLHLIRIV